MEIEGQIFLWLVRGMIGLLGLSYLCAIPLAKNGWMGDGLVARCCGLLWVFTSLSIPYEQLAVDSKGTVYYASATVMPWARYQAFPRDEVGWLDFQEKGEKGVPELRLVADGSETRLTLRLSRVFADEVAVALGKPIEVRER